jgi:murein DD-endopeptidase MepM/ murein hydrolase activator NlpD
LRSVEALDSRPDATPLGRTTIKSRPRRISRTVFVSATATFSGLAALFLIAIIPAFWVETKQYFGDSQVAVQSLPNELFDTKPELPSSNRLEMTETSAPTQRLIRQPARLTGSTTATEESSPLPKFRWPVNGRVISAFGPISNGQQNDGINIAVPENTPIAAAEEGTVAYAGNKLKGYGNLILIRHSNGYVTGYAHAKELLVKHGDLVKRGQIIARSGRSGGVNTPQLHFEIRKGANPVDPMRLLNGE